MRALEFKHLVISSMNDTHRQTIPIHWFLPTSPSYKLNVDGVFSANRQQRGIGGVVRIQK